ncbi:MAG: mannose-phosphate guanylyltransferase [Candidatus Saccharibacteria bacterium]|nr:mannose-phosphate guanylyltransferase [Candidatus Saccharibacteria bacterium]
MIIVVIAGGSGTRLWPISTPAYPKHLLKVGNDSRSMLQNTYYRASKLSKKIYVVSEINQLPHIQEQLPGLNEDHLIIEPARRGTAHCIIAALARIKSREDASEPIVFMAADHYIRDTKGFVQTFTIAAETATVNNQITLVGIKPDYAATGFGYIKKGALSSEHTVVYNVECFEEKPAYDDAQAYLESGEYLWNASYFVGSLNVFESEMAGNAPELYTSYQQLLTADDFSATYQSFGNESIDYALIEKVPHLQVVPAAFDWVDLGSFADFSKAIGGDIEGNYIHGPNIELFDVSNSLVQNYEDKQIAIIGIDNCVVINTPHGLLVTRKDLSQKVGLISRKPQ